MAGGKDIKRQPKPKPMKAGTKGLALNPEDCVCCTPSMAGSVLGRLSRLGGIRRSKAPRRTSPQSIRESKSPTPSSTVAKRPGPRGDESIEKVALRAGLHVVKATWKPKQTSPDAVFFDLRTGELVGHASAREMFDEARRLGAKRAAEGALVRWTPPVQWFPTLRRREPEAKFWRAIDNTWPYHYAAVQLEERGSVSPGKIVRLDVLARAGFTDQDREVLRGLGQEAELQAARGLFVGLNHGDAMTLGFVGALSSAGLTRAQAYAALTWSPRDARVPAPAAKRDASTKPKTPPRRKASRVEAPAKVPTTPSASPEASGSVAKDDGPPVRMDVVLRDLKDAAEANGQSVQRKHVAKAVRAMLNARQLGLSVTAPNYSFASTLDIRVKGSRFTAQQNAALRALFGEDAGTQNEFTVLVTRFIGNADSVPTGIVPSRIEAFRRRVAEAAGLSIPGPFNPDARRTAPKPRSMGSALSMDEVVRLAAMLVDLAKEAGIDAEAGLRTGTGEVLLVYGERNGMRGEARMSASPQGMVFIQGSKHNPDNARVFALFEAELAPVVSLGAPRRSGESAVYFGLPAKTRTANLDAKESELLKRFGVSTRIAEFPNEAAANSAPSAADRGRSKGIAVASPPAPTRAPATSKSGVVVAEVRRAGSTAKGAPVRMDIVLQDLRDAAKAKGQDVERKHIAKALRVMLQARRYGLSITTPDHAFATTLDIQPGKGRSDFSEVQNAVLKSLFGEDSRRSSTFLVLVDPFVSNSGSVPTGIVPARIEEFRREVAKAAGVDAPGPFDPEAKRGQSNPSRPRAAVPSASPSPDRMEDEKVMTLLEAFIDMVNATEEPEHPLLLRTTEKAMVVMAGPLGARTRILSVRTSPQGFTVAQGRDPRLAEMFLDTFALPMRGDETSRTEQTRSFAWAPKSEWGKRWARTMGDFAVPVSLPSDSGSDSEVQTGDALGIGRADHEERRDNRVLGLRTRADKARGEAQSRYEASGRDLPPWGEPIKIGHHSERRHRRALDRSHANMSKSVEATRKAVRLDARADAAEGNTAISSDDPRALERLKAKLAQMEAEREETKRKNRLARQGKLPDAENPLNPAAIWHVAGKRKYPMPGYALKNLGAEIRRVRERIETLSKRQGRAARSLERGDVQVVENGELNRLQIFTGSKPPKENRTWLKINGFRWARSEGAWQRHIGDGAWNAAMLYLDEFVEKRDDTPYARVEATEAKPTDTEKDLEFWRSEFEALDGEFPGKDFDDAMLTKVTEALRARGAGMPSLQAHAYSEYRIGRATLEEAVASMFVYRRHARPKRRPRSPRTPVTSSMGREAFLSEVKKRGSKLGGQLFSSRGRGGDIYLHHYNVPKTTEDETRRENNRLMVSVEGWERDGTPPKNGKVTLEVLVSPRLKDLRGRTTTPETMVDVVVEMFRRHSALKSV